MKGRPGVTWITGPEAVPEAGRRFQSAGGKTRSSGTILSNDRHMRRQAEPRFPSPEERPVLPTSGEPRPVLRRPHRHTAPLRPEARKPCGSSSPAAEVVGPENRVAGAAVGPGPGVGDGANADPRGRVSRQTGQKAAVAATEEQGWAGNLSATQTP